jgi:ATP-dependent DNA helicase RecG
VELTLSSPLSEFQGVGPKRSALLAALGVLTVWDLLNFFPRRYEDRRSAAKISELVPGRAAVVNAKVESVERRRLSKPGLELVTALVTDGSGELAVVWFNRKGLEYVLKEGTAAVFYGVPSLRAGTFEMMNPEFEVCGGENEERFTGIVPIYPSTAGLPVRWFRSLAADVVEEALPLVEETLPAAALKKRSLMPLREALRTMHRPDSEQEWKQARQRLAYEEFFTLQTAMALKRKRMRDSSAACRIIPGPVYKKFLASLPFPLTASQTKALQEIFADTKHSWPMSRLLQGDVGSGKTLVAVGLAAAAADCGVQTAIMAPTEVLASQLFAQCLKWLEPLGVKSVLLKGGQSAAERRETLAAIEDGSAPAAVGTQALIENGVKFKKLGALVIDEQHRFGVEQREALLKNRRVPHVLMMSATPIPRTLTMCLFGDLDVSVLAERPAERRKTETRLIDVKKMGALLQFIINEAAAGGRIFWVCPRVEEDDASEAASAERRRVFLGKHLGALGVGLLHGRMNAQEKERSLNDFRAGRTRLLVTTTVVEVGVDVPEASVIVIESPERFGLSQLHQLRGRVGRGKRRGVCVLLVKDLADGAPERLSVMLATDDGFEIAEADLKFRGSGELAGSAQHGDAGFKVADLAKDARLLYEAKEDAEEFVAAAPVRFESPYFARRVADYMQGGAAGKTQQPC